ncbi:hypothetical protein AVEN_106361-1 [Araneus ventricosus]|uniref:Uncharacterized protein n=1 Tax=Araneus ventricosus TaxID=182803 RepID=A0A4Y2AUQ0_ARAVE|nr:hypothetical protein AVEN_106361-1 [Araneus ventricosus]
MVLEQHSRSGIFPQNKKILRIFTKSQTGTSLNSFTVARSGPGAERPLGKRLLTSSIDIGSSKSEVSGSGLGGSSFMAAKEGKLGELSEGRVGAVSQYVRKSSSKDKRLLEGSTGSRIWLAHRLAFLRNNS